MILDNYKEFVDTITDKLNKLGIDTSVLYIDHLGYQASSLDDYEKKKEELYQIGEIKHDVQVGEKKVAIFKLFNPLKYLHHTIEAVEIVSPKEGQTLDSSWEHIEIVPQEGLETFMNKYPNIDWDTSVIDRDIFPMLIVKLGGKTRAKFPKRAVLEEVERIKSA